MRVRAGVDPYMHGQLGIHRHRAEEFLDELVLEIPCRSGRQRGVEHQQPAARYIDGTRCPGLVHRNRGVAVAADPGSVLERVVKRLADADADVLDRVVRSGLQVAPRPRDELEVTVTGEQVEHVIEEPDAGVAPAGAVAVEPDAHMNLRLAGGSIHVTSTVVDFREPQTSIVALGVSLVFLIMVALAAGKIRQRFIDQTRRAELAAWQLRQLVPKIRR